MGSAVQAKGVAVWWPVPEVRFVELRNPITAEDADLLLTMLKVDVSPSVPKHCSLVDVRGLAEVPGELEAIPLWVASHRDSLDAKIVRAAVVYSRVTGAAAMAGFHSVADVPYETRLFTKGEMALKWLGFDPIGLWECWDRSISQRLVLDLKSRVIACCRADLRHCSLESCAKALGLSGRSLQRRLQEQRLSLRALLHGERLRLASELLVGDLKLSAVAMEAGFGKAEVMNKAFIAEYGVSASDWRARKRAL